MKMDVLTYSITDYDTVLYFGILLGMLISITLQLIWRVMDAIIFLFNLWNSEDARDEVGTFIKAVKKSRK